MVRVHQEMLATVHAGLNSAVKSNDVWHALAIQHWGRHTPGMPPVEGWRTWCLHRLPTCKIRRSPLSLLQESYNDPWKHVIACVLCSRTSGSSTIANTIASFFEAFPSPSAVLDAEDADIKAIIFPLGLQPVRCRAARDISARWFGEWQSPDEFFGCGAFVHDSFRIFCKGDTSGQGVQDLNLKRYLAWIRGQSQTQPKANKPPRSQKKPQPAKDAGAGAAGGRQLRPRRAAGVCGKGTGSREGRQCTVAANSHDTLLSNSGRGAREPPPQAPARSVSSPPRKRPRREEHRQPALASNQASTKGAVASKAPQGSRTRLRRVQQVVV